MAETEEEIEATEDEAEVDEAPTYAPGVVYYLVRSVIRGRTNRTARAQQVGRRGFVQRLAGGTILVRRARPARITEAVLLANFDELKKAENEHRIQVTTVTGQYVDLNTFEAEPLAVAKPLPNPPLDSAKNDKNEGIGYNVPATPMGSDEVPELLRGSMPEGIDAQIGTVEQPPDFGTVEQLPDLGIASSDVSSSRKHKSGKKGGRS